MRERFNNSENAEEKIYQRLLEKFSDVAIPYKIRKIELLKDVNLPVPKAEYFDRKNLGDLEQAIINKIAEDPETPLVIRVACVPDKLSMPIFYMEKEEDFKDNLHKIESLIENEPTITNFILQEATPQDKTRDKISGRFLFAGQEMLPLESALEIYKGSRSTAILNRAEISDQNFLRFEKKAGHFLRPTKEIDYEATSITEDEIRAIARYLDEYRDNMELAKKVFSASDVNRGENEEACFEFSYRDREINFIDID